MAVISWGDKYGGGAQKKEQPKPGTMSFSDGKLMFNPAEEEPAPVQWRPQPQPLEWWYTEGVEPPAGFAPVNQPQPAAVEQPANPLDQHGRGQSGQSRTMANGDVYNYWAKYGQEMTRQGLIRQGVMDGTNYNSNNPLFDLRSSNMPTGMYGVGDLLYDIRKPAAATAGTGYGGYGRGYGYGYGGGGGSYNYSRPKPKWFMEMLSWRI